MRIIPVITIAINLIFFSVYAYAEKRQTIRFYKLNSKDQPVRVIVREKTAKASGCHNFLGEKTIYRLTQIGFEYCSVYSEKNCVESSILEGLWDEKDNASQLTQGGEWLFNYDLERGLKMKSWSCQ